MSASVSTLALSSRATWHARLWAARELLWALAMRDIQVRYKQSALGAAWAIVQPLSMAIIFSVAFGYFVKVPTDGIPYPIFAYAAMVPWTLFASSISAAVPSVVGHGSLITKIYFPREVLPVAAIVGCIFDFLTASVVLIPMMLFYRVMPSFYIIWVPVLVALAVALALGIGLALSAINVFYRDIRSIIPLLMQLWMFASPIVYPISLVPAKYRALYGLNPMVGVIDGFRRVLLQGKAPDLVLLAAGVPTILVVLVVGYKIFTSLERRFADVV